MRSLLHGRNAKRGQARILEAVIASAIIFLVFSVATFLTGASSQQIQEKSDLDRLGYNVLSRLVESGTMEKTLENNPGDLTLVRAQLNTFLQTALPSATLFKLTISEYSLTRDWVVLGSPIVLNNFPSSIENTLEVSSTPMVYTSHSGKIYSITLVLARSGG